MMLRNGIAKYPVHVLNTIRTMIDSSFNRLADQAYRSVVQLKTSGVDLTSRKVLKILPAIGSIPFLSFEQEQITVPAKGLPYYSRERMVRLFSRSGLSDSALLRLLHNIDKIEYKIRVCILIVPNRMFMPMNGAWGGFQTEKIFEDVVNNTTDRVLNLGMIIIPIPYEELGQVHTHEYMANLDKILQHELKHLIQTAFLGLHHEQVQEPLVWRVKGSQLHDAETIPGVDSIVDTYAADAVATYFAFILRYTAHLRITEDSIRTLAEIIIYVAILTFREDLSTQDKKRLFGLFKRSIYNTQFDVGAVKHRAIETRLNTSSTARIAESLNTTAVRQFVSALKALLPQKTIKPMDLPEFNAQEQEYAHKIDNFTRNVLKVLELTWRRTPALP